MTENPEAIFVYIVAPDLVTARKLGRSIVEEKLAVSVNILPGMQAIYRWQGRIEEANEVVMFVKTTRDRFSDIQDYIALAHPYEVPCLVALPIVECEPAFIKWIVDNSRI